MFSFTFLVSAALSLAALGVIIYNRLVTSRNRFINAFSQIDVQLQRRHELIPNLVTVAGKYMDHENETLVGVTLARDTAENRRQAAAADPADSERVGALSRAEGLLDGQLGKLSLVMESYPDLKADANLRELHDEIASSENRVSFARQAYSDAVMRYNTQCEQFPAVLVARLLGFKAADPFEIRSEAMREAVQVSFA